MTLEEALHDRMLAAYRTAGRETGNWGHYFLRSVKKHGGLETARRMLRPFRGKAVPKGLKALCAARRADLTLEVLVLQPKFAPLFTLEELQEARRRIADLPKGAMPRSVQPEENYPETAIDDRIFAEGGRKRVTVNAYERDPRARRACIRHHGTSCLVCGLSFEERYGPRGNDFIHVHHRARVAARGGRYRLNAVRDLVPVCPNCHAMLHTQDPPLAVEELRYEMSQLR